MKKNIAMIVLALSLAVFLICALLIVLSVEPAEPTVPSETQTNPSPQQNNYQLIISEICSKNDTIIADADGRHRDYIELYNLGKPVNLEGLRLTDGKGISQPFGDQVLASGEYLVIFIADDLTGFALGAAGGDCIQLLDAQGGILTQATTQAMESNQVMIWSEGSYILSNQASPGFPNDEKGVSMFLYGEEETNPKLVFSELLINNVYALPDESLQYSDVLELHNISDEEVDLSNYYLSDSIETRMRYRLPAITLAPGEYILIWCDRGNYVSENGNIHADFAISEGETLYLTDLNDRHVNLTAVACGDDRSLSRKEDGSYAPGAVSLGYGNDEAGVSAFQRSRFYADAPLVINEILLSSAQISYRGGFYDVVEIWNRSNEIMNTAGWYLSDGGDPFEYALPQQELAPGEYLVILCNSKTTGFSLSRKDALQLTAPDHRYSLPVSCADGSVSRVETDGVAGYVSMAVTLGYANTAANHLQYLRDQYGNSLMISEIMSSNQSYLPGAYATTCDWIELYNATDKDLLLSDYFLTDDADYLWQYQLPEKTLHAGERIVIFLSETGKNLLSGYSVLPFNLSSAGENLYLSNKNGIVDCVDLPALQQDTSYGRPDGSITYSLLEQVTPGKSNGDAAKITDMPVAVTPQGVYDDVEYLDIEFTGEGKIYYTTDCTMPDRTSIPYTGPIRITQTTVFRVICIADGKQPSKVLDLTYLLNEDDTLSVVTLVTEPDNLWDWETGIYVKGPNASSNSPYYGANYWQDWEIPATVSLFETNGSGFTSACGVKIFGGYSRYEDKKSLACFFRAKYGAPELDYPLFGEAGLDTYEAFVLRNCGQDVFWARMRDVLITSLVAEQTTVPVQKYKPVVVYLNGEYFGLHYIREKLNTNYVAGNFNVEAEDVVLCESEGLNSSAYRSLLKYAMKYDMKDPEHYEYVCSRIDVDNYIDYMIAQIWIGNTDNSNVRFFKTTEGKWTWILYDTDMSFATPNYNSVAKHLNKKAIGDNDWTSKTLAVCLLDNPEFKDMFLRRMAWQINNLWTEENIVGRIDEIEAMIKDDMVKDCQRWGRTYTYWQQSVASLRKFARIRNDYLLGYIQDYFGLTTDEMIQYGFPV